EKSDLFTACVGGINEHFALIDACIQDLNSGIGRHLGESKSSKVDGGNHVVQLQLRFGQKIVVAKIKPGEGKGIALYRVNCTEPPIVLLTVDDTHWLIGLKICKDKGEGVVDKAIEVVCARCFAHLKGKPFSGTQKVFHYRFFNFVARANAERPGPETCCATEVMPRNNSGPIGVVVA